jgi:hypothetical protein
MPQKYALNTKEMAQILSLAITLLVAVAQQQVFATINSRERIVQESLFL